MRQRAVVVCFSDVGMLSWCEVGLVMSNVVGGWSFKYRSSLPEIVVGWCGEQLHIFYTASARVGNGRAYF